MQKANLIIIVALLVSAAGLNMLSKKLYNSRKNHSGAALMELTTDMFHKDSTKNMLDRQVSVQVLKGTAGDTLDVRGVAGLPAGSFEFKERCCNFIGDGRHIIWLRFSLVNKSSFENFLVEVVNPFINDITYYSLHTKKDTSYSTGTDSIFDARYDKNYRNFHFPAILSNNDTAQFYLRIKSELPLHLRILVFEKEERAGHQQWIVDVLMTIFYVFSALFLILMAILITATNEPFYWYYFGYVLLTALFIPAHLGLGFMYIWKNNGDFQHVVPMALNCLRLVFGIQFFRLYFDLPKIAVRFNRFIGIAIKVFLFILLLQIIQGIFGQRFTREVFVLFLAFLALFSLVMLAWLLRELFFKRRRRFSWLLLVVALNIVGVGITSLQHLGWGLLGFDASTGLLALFGIANTFFLSPFVIAAFFLEQVLVFNFAVRRYLRLIEKNQKVQLHVARAKEEGLNALILGVENERRRIARDLHDSACVNLAAINMKVDALRDELADNPAHVLKIADIADDLDRTYREVRGISHDLMSKSLEKTDLQTALEDLAVRIQQTQPGLAVHFYANYPLDKVNDLAKIHLYRISQELLANVLKHAHAKTVNLQLLEDEGNLLLTVEDDGQGFEPSKNKSDGIGLSNIQTRVEVLRGKMNLDSTPGKGAFVSIEIPGAALAQD